MKNTSFRVWDSYSQAWLNDKIVMQQDGTLLYKEKGNIYSVDSMLPLECELIVSQNTGLFDKSATEIYEGDIIKWDNIICKVTYHKARFVLSTDKTLCYRDLSYTHQDCEILGNIYDNKDLLKENK